MMVNSYSGIFFYGQRRFMCGIFCLEEGCSMRIAAAYLRVSTEEQDEYSLDSQLKMIREYANKNDYIVPDEYVFVDDGISGRTAKKRNAFQSMIAQAKEKDRQFEAILLWKFSRFARNQEESIVYKAMLRKLGVSVISISEPLPDGPFASLIERIIEWMDEFYSIRLAGEVKRGMQEKASRGEPVAPAPFGYRMEDNRLIPDEKAPIVREVFSMYAAGRGQMDIARCLGDRGVRTNRGTRPENRFIEYMLNNPVYIGKIRWSKEGRTASKRKYDDENIVVYDGKHEPIISEELWQTVQNRLSQEKKMYRPRTRRNEPIAWMLKGLVHCSNCGSTLCYQSAAGSIQCYKYAHGQCTKSHSISVVKINRIVIETLENAVDTLSFNMEPRNVKTAAAGSDAERLIQLEERKLVRVQEAYEAGIDDIEEYANKKRKIQTEIERLKKLMPAPEAKAFDKIEFAKKVSSVLRQIKSPDVSETAKNEALRTIISKIVYNKSAQNIDIYFYI